MKFLNLFLVAMMSLSISQAFAGHRSGSILNLQVGGQSQWTVELGGEVFNFIDGNIRIENIRPGHLALRISETVSHRGYGNRYHSVQRNVFNGSINIKPHSETFARIGSCGSLFIDRVAPIVRALNPCIHGCAAGACTHHVPPRGHRNGRGGNYRHGGGYGNGYGNGSVGAGYGSGFVQPVGFNGGHANQAVIVCGTEPNRFNALLGTIEDRWFDSSKLELAKSVALNNSLTADQVRSIMFAFDFESSRMQFAKFAFTSVCDPENYFLVYDAFDFDSSVTELSRFTARR